MKKTIMFAAFVLAVVMISPAAAQYSVQFDSTGIWLNGMDSDTIFIAFRDKPGRAWNIDTSGTGSIEAAKVGQRVFFPDSILIVLQRSNKKGTADSFKVSYAFGHPTSLDTTIGDTTYLIGGATTFGNITNDTSFVLNFNRWGSWMRFFYTQGDTADSITTYLRTIFVRKESGR